jgi:hypothetical protein
MLLTADQSQLILTHDKSIFKPRLAWYYMAQSESMLYFNLQLISPIVVSG